MSDLRYAVRQLAKSPGFSATAVLTLALGIGACTAIFSVVNGVLLHPPDFSETERVVVLKEKTPPPASRENPASVPNFIDWEKMASSFSSIAAYTGASINLTGQDEPRQLSATKVTARYFDVFGLHLVLGRAFVPADDAPGKNRVVVVSFSFWQRVFGGAPDAIGRSLQLDGEPFTVIGVASPDSSRTDVWVPLIFTPEQLADDNRGAHFLNVVARLKPGVTVAQAGAEMTLISERLARQYPSSRDWGVFVTSLLNYNVRGMRTALYTLLGAVGCVLLISCTNVANLLLARATARQHEISIRAALGAGRARIVRQLLTESVLLAVLGGAAGVLLARWGLDAMVAASPVRLPVHLDRSVLAFAFGLSVATGLAFGLAPAWLVARQDVNEALKQGSRGATEGGARRRLRSGFVVLQIAAALVLLAGAGLLVRSFGRIARIDPGFNPENTTVLRLSLPAGKYREPAQRIDFTGTLLARVRRLPGVAAAGIAQFLPLGGGAQGNGFTIRNHPVPENLPVTNYDAVTPGYFQAMRIRLVRGRFFTAQDDVRAPRVAIINETLARRQFPGEDPIGQQINLTNGTGAWREIVGIVADVSQNALDRAPPPQTYEPFAQNPGTTINVVVRTAGAPAMIAGQLRPAVYAVDKEQPVGSVRPLAEILSGSIARQRFAMLLLGIFSLVALVIAAVGIYGVMVCTVSQRTAEFGIRLALGARPRDLLQLVLGQGGRLVGLGLVLGLAGAFAAGRAIRSMLYQTSTHDPLTLAAIMLVAAGVALLACWLPARRATKVDPLVALRAE